MAEESARPEVAPQIPISSPGEEPAIAEPPRDEAPIELPIEPVPDPAEPEPAILAWDQGPPEPLDQPLDLPEPPELLRSSRPGLTPVWLLGALAVAVAALLVFRTRPAGNVPAAAPAAVSTAVPTPLPTVSSAAAAAPSMPLAASGSDVTPSPTAIPATPVPPSATAPPPTTVPTRLPPTPSPPAAAAARPVATDRRQWLERAARDRSALAGDRGALYTIQLELVCELPSLEEALRYDRQRAMRILVSDHRGRECFRVVWGGYPTLSEAILAKASAPRFFFTPTNHPVVVSTRALLP